MAIQLRQIALVARELAPAIDDLCGIFGIELDADPDASAPPGLTRCEFSPPAERTRSLHRFHTRWFRLKPVM